jgi:hypothetical protein
MFILISVRYDLRIVCKLDSCSEILTPSSDPIQLSAHCACIVIDLMTSMGSKLK